MKPYQNRIVVKVGTSTLTNELGKSDLRCFDRLACVLSDIQYMGIEVIDGLAGLGLGVNHEDATGAYEVDMNDGEGKIVLRGTENIVNTPYDIEVDYPSGSKSVQYGDPDKLSSLSTEQSVGIKIGGF